MRFHTCTILAACLLVAADAPKKDPNPTAPTRPLTEVDKLIGTWTVIAMEYKGKTLPKEVYKDNQLIFTDNDISTRKGDKTIAEARYAVPDKGNPKQLITVPKQGPKKGQRVPCIYLLDGDTLKICGPDTTKDAPKTFATKADNDYILITLRRAKP
jgi:uncharacterized protein (TIGR03067 family)